MKRLPLHRLRVCISLAIFLTVSLQIDIKALPIYQANNFHAQANALFKQGNTLLEAGQLRPAISRFETALLFYREANDYRGEAFCLLTIGFVKDSLADYQGAIDAYEMALSIWQAIGDHTGEGTTLNSIALAYYNLDRYEQALNSSQEALIIARAINDHFLEGTILNGIGVIYHKRGLYKQAMKSHQQALAIAQAIGNDKGKGDALNNIAGIYDDSGQYRQALESYQQALNLAQAIGDRPGEWTTLSNIAGVYDILGQYTQALKSYQQALNILRDIHDLAGEGGVLANIGLVYQNLGQHERALESYEQALSIAQTIGNRSGEGVILFNIGWVYYNLERYAQALERYQQALVILQDIGDRAGEGRVFNNIGSVYHTRGQYEQALASFQYALASAQAIGDQAGEGVARNNIAEVYDGLAQYEEARKSYEYARIILHNIGMRIGEGIVLANIGSLYENQHDVDRAILYYQRSITITELIQGDISIAELKSSFVSGQSDIYARLINLLWTGDQPEKAFEYAERARARSFLNQMGNQRVDFRQDAAPELIQEERGLRLRIITLQNDLALDRNDPEQQDQELTDKLSSNLEQARKQYEQLLVRLKLANPEYASLISVGTLSLEEIQHKVLGSQTTLVEYFVMDNHTLAWVIDQEGFKVIDLAITRDELTGQIEFLRNLVNVKPFDPGASAGLYDTLIDPLVPYIHHANLIIVPHGVLHYLPFAALWNAKNERYLIEDYTITYAPSASVLKFILEKRSPNDGRLLVMGNPNGSLPSAEEEARSVAELYGVESLVGKQATESEIYSHTDTIDVLHLAVHGYLDPFNPLFTRIELSADNENDGNLEVHEIFGLELTGTNLVVLSACETALGEQSTGDEFVGLTRAFLYAGASSIVTSLWKVDDKASATLMRAFHRHLRTGMTTAEALRSAQLEVLRQERWRSPYYWATFSLHGDYLGHEE